jgi:hypothetical protein
MTNRPDSKTLADYVGHDDPLVLKRRLGEMPRKHGDDKAYDLMVANIAAANGKAVSPSEWLWLNKQRAHVIWQQNE